MGQLRMGGIPGKMELANYLVWQVGILGPHV
jgi:hypothetical protein